MSTMDKINKLLLMAKRYDEIIRENTMKTSRERQAYIRYVTRMWCKSDL